jgi:hypothetical protein
MALSDQSTSRRKTGASAHNKNATTNWEFVGTAAALDGSTFTIDGTVVGLRDPQLTSIAPEYPRLSGLDSGDHTVPKVHVLLHSMLDLRLPQA